MPWDSDWRSRAACRGMPLELFVPSEGTRVSWVYYRPALRVCARCTVRSECLADALEWEDSGARMGVAGGLTPNERNAIYAVQLRAGERERRYQHLTDGDRHAG